MTGGGAVGQAKLSVGLTTNDTGGAGTGCVAGTCETASLSETRLGWAVGAGLEYALWSNWSLRAEYLHYDLGTMSVTAFDPAFGPGANMLTGSLPVRGDIVRGAVNFKFGP